MADPDFESPFADNSGDDRSADARAIEHMEERAKELEANDDPPEVQTFDPEETLDVKVEDSEEEKVSRNEKRANRYQDAKDERDSHRDRANRLEAELAVARSQSQQQIHRPAAPMDDPLEKELDDTYNQRKQVFSAWEAKRAQGSMTQQDSDDYMNQARKLERKERDLEGDIRDRKRNASRDPNELIRAQIQARHMDVYGDNKAVNWAEGLYQQKIAEGDKDSMELLDDCMDKARMQFRIGKKGRAGHESSKRDQQRFAGPPRGAGAAAGPPTRTIKMTHDMRRMADEYGRHIKDQGERMQHWVNGPGRNWIAAEKESGRG